MLSYYQITAASGLAVLATLTGSTLGQKTLPDNEIAFIGAGVCRANDPSLVNYTLQYEPPFSYNSGGCYYWAVNNNTVAVANFAGYTAPSDSVTKCPFFTVGEGNPKPINTSTSGWGCEDRHHARD
jgi:hypothetical protein